MTGSQAKKLSKYVFAQHMFVRGEDGHALRMFVRVRYCIDHDRLGAYNVFLDMRDTVSVPQW